MTTDGGTGIWLRPAPRPEWGRDDVEWWWKLDTHYRLPESDEADHKCSTRGCSNAAWLIRDQQVGGYGRQTRHVRRRWCCQEHVYGEAMVEDGKVYRPLPRFDEHRDIGAELAAELGKKMTVEEAANRLVNAILVEFSDRDDDYLMPMRSLFEEIGAMCNVRDFDSSVIPEWESMGWLRERSRAALARLAEGEKIP